MSRGFSSIGQNAYGRNERWDKKYPFFDLRSPQRHNKWFVIRPLGIPSSHHIHWVGYLTKEGVRKAFALECSRWDPELETFDKKRSCCVCEAQKNFPDWIESYTEWFANFIIREAQQSMPADATPGMPGHIGSHPEEVASQFRELSHTSWSPIMLVRLPQSVVFQLRGIAPLNQRINPQTGRPEVYEMSDPLNGCDLFIKYNPDAAPAQKYIVNKGDPNSLTAEELKYKLWNVDALVEYDDADNRSSLERLGYLKKAEIVVAEAANSPTMNFDQPAANVTIPPAAMPTAQAPSAVPPAAFPQASAPSAVPASSSIPQVDTSQTFIPPWAVQQPQQSQIPQQGEQPVSIEPQIPVPSGTNQSGSPSSTPSFVPPVNSNIPPFMPPQG